MDNEPDRTWNKEMRSLVQEMIHFRNECQPFQEPDPVKVSEFEKRYREILEIARAEYGNVPANNYYRDGYNLFLRMEKYMRLVRRMLWDPFLYCINDSIQGNSETGNKVFVLPSKVAINNKTKRGRVLS